VKEWLDAAYRQMTLVFTFFKWVYEHKTLCGNERPLFVKYSFSVRFNYVTTYLNSLEVLMANKTNRQAVAILTVTLIFNLKRHTKVPKTNADQFLHCVIFTSSSYRKWNRKYRIGLKSLFGLRSNDRNRPRIRAESGPYRPTSNTAYNLLLQKINLCFKRVLNKASWQPCCSTLSPNCRGTWSVSFVSSVI